NSQGSADAAAGTLTISGARAVPITLGNTVSAQGLAGGNASGGGVIISAFGNIDVQKTVNLTSANGNGGSFFITCSSPVISLNSTGVAGDTAIVTTSSGTSQLNNSGVIAIAVPTATLNVTGSLNTSGGGSASAGSVGLQAGTISMSAGSTINATSAAAA